MGGRQSTSPRTVHMDNPNPYAPQGVIQISEDVVHRLRTTKPVQAESTKSRVDDAPREARNSGGGPSSSNSAHYPPPAAIYYGEPTISALEVRRQKEQELAQNDQYWRNRLANLEQTLNKTTAIMEQEYSAAIEDVRKRFHNAPPTRQLPPCQDLKAHLIACYRANPGETLKCSEEVAAFANCVSENRVKKLDANEAEGQEQQQQKKIPGK